MTVDVLHAATVAALGNRIAREGFVFTEAAVLRGLLESREPLTNWEAFASSWNDLGVDTYMGDGGRYRRRRHARFSIDAQGQQQRLPHGPHYQSSDYNPLNGGVERWFEPITGVVGDSSILQSILAVCHAVFTAASDLQTRWHVEVHQFRIEARHGEPGLPTPEGVHRDGVDYVLAMMVCRRNIASGTTSVHSANGQTLGNFTLVQAFDAALLDDNRVWHGVTPVEPLDASAAAFRDVLVVTFSRSRTGAGGGAQS